MAARQAGVTLMELVVVMILIAVLLAIGVPSYRSVTTSNRMATEMEGLLDDLQYARSEAVREGQTVTVCVAQSVVSPYSCAPDGTDTWQDGWLVFRDVAGDQVYDASTDGVPLRVQTPFGHGDTFQASGGDVSYVTFNRDGFAYLGAGGGMTVTLKDSTGDDYYTRCLSLSESGMMTTNTGTNCP